MKIIKASEWNLTYTRQDVVDWMCSNVMKNIQRANNEGSHKASFYGGCGYWDNDKKEFTYSKGDNRPFVHWYDYRDEVAEVFREAGYKIKPTGKIGGVWQDTEDIIW